MSRARHHHGKPHKASGGSVDYYEGGNSNVAKEAAEKEQKKHGGKVMGKVHGGKSHKRMDKRARGGRIDDMKEDKKVADAAVHKHEKHLHKGEKETKFKSGGRVGSDKSPMAPGSATHPFSSAARS